MKTAAQEYAKHLTFERQLLPLGYIEHMPLKVVSEDELYEVMTQADYNPTRVYKDYPHPDDIGHDQCYRYQLEETKK